MGVPTVGFGHTGPDVSLGMTITPARADALLAEDLSGFERAVEHAVLVPISQDEFDALVAFSFNIGAGAFRRSTLLRLLNVGDRTGAAAQFARWNRAGGRVLAGLTRRRAAEAALFRGEPAE